MSKINVQDKIITTQSTVKSVEIENLHLELNKSAIFSVKMFDENSSLVSIERVDIIGDDYNNWGSDDNYVVTFIFNKLGLTEL